MAAFNFKKKISTAGADLTLVAVVIFLLVFGIIMIYSASSYESMLKFNDAQYYLKKQIRNVIIAILAFSVVSGLDYHMWVWVSKIVYGVAWVLVVLVQPFGLEVNGAKRWLALGPIQFQPAEIAKISVILLTAYMITRTEKKDMETIPGMIRVLFPAAFMAATVFLANRNLSSAAIIFLIAVVMFFVSCKNYKYFVILGAVGSAGIALLVYLIYTDAIGAVSFRFSRVKAWLMPEADSQGYGFQTLQSLYSIGSGGFWGKGLGESMQKLGVIPEAQNDMIFSIICEELGIFGAATVMFLFLFLVWRCQIVAQNAPDVYGSLISTGVMAHIALQVVLNIAVVTNTVPNTGVTLPFISYGGKAVIFVLAEIGMVISVSRRIIFE